MRGEVRTGREVLGVALVAWVFTRVLLLVPLRADSNDVRVYLDVAEAWLAGVPPYAGAVFEYPPGAALIALVPRLFLADGALYPIAFAIWMLCFDASNAVLVRALARAEGSSEARAGVAVLAYSLSTAALGELGLQRFDAPVVTSILVALLLARRGPRFASMTALGIGVLLKIVPIVLVPLLLCDRFLRDHAGATVSRGALARFALREALPQLLVLSAVVALGFAPFLGHLDGVRASLAYQGARGVQIESTWASLLMLIDRFVTPLQLAEQFSHGASHLASSAERWVAPLSWLSIAGAVTAATAVTVWRSRDGHPRLLVEGAAAVLLGVLCASRVLSPQFLLWVLPLVAVLCARDERPGGLASLTTLTVLLSGFVLLAAYGGLQELELLAIVLLFARNALLCAMWLVVLVGRRAAVVPDHRWRAIFTLGLLALLAVDLNFREVTQSDFWLHRAIGHDILATRSIPQVDGYSATASGAEFVAHEWLAAVLLTTVDNVLGAFGLFVVRAGAVFAVASMMVLALGRKHRRSALVIPLAVLAVIVIELRADVRPHLLALVIVAALSLALARWRRRGAWGPLLWLAPLHALWANLHASCFFGPAFLVVLGAIVSVAPIRRRAWFGTELPRDAAQLFAAAALAFGACLLNPRGPRLLSYALDVGLNGRFIHEWIDEWRGTLEIYTPSAQLIAYLVLIGCAWLSIASGGPRRARPLHVALAFVATWMSLRAVRFHAEAAVLLFPIVVEHASAALRRHRARLSSAPLFDGALVLTVALLGVFTFKDSIGTQLDRRLPRAAVEVLRQHDARVVFNEYEDGGYLIDQLRPRTKVVIDGRIDVYGPERVRDYRRARRDLAFFDSYADLHGVDAVLVAVGVGVPNVTLFEHLRAHPERWTLVYDGDWHVLFVRTPDPLVRPSDEADTASPSGREQR
jgi:Glycosyltransferase family 87